MIKNLNLQWTGERVVPDQMDAKDKTYLEHLARYEFAVEHKKGKLTLDAACGSGYGTKMLNAEGVDVSEETINYACEKYGIVAFFWDLEQGLSTTYWDTIVSFETIEHLTNPDLFLKDAAKKSKQFIFSIPLNNPSQFHKQVYSLDQAQKLIYRYFNKVEWFEQTETIIKKLQSDNPVFLIGIASNQDHPQADLIVVSHNSKKDLERFLPSIKKHTENYTLTIVDNSDQEETKEYVRQLNGVFIENKGYGAACNAGAKNVNSEFIVFLNSDLEASEGWMDELLKPFNDERVGIVGVRLFDSEGKEYPTPEKDMAIGCVFAMRRKIFDELKGFDENYFLFFEETDMCKRAIYAGYKVIRSEAKLTHFNPNFLPAIQQNPFLKKCWDQSKAYFEKKHNIIYGQQKPQGKRILIGIPCGSGMLSAYAVDGLFKLIRPCPVSLVIIERQSSDAARNYIIELAIRLQVDYIFFVDDDGVLPPDALVKLLEDDKDIVGAPLMTRNIRDNGQHALCVFEKFDFYIGDGRTINKYRSMRGFDNSKGYLHNVDAMGASCMLIKKEVYEALFAKHNGRPFEFIHEIHQTKEHGITVRNISEDMCFSERAKQEGFEIWIDARIRPVHLGKPEFIRFEQEGENWETISNPLKCADLLSENLKSLN